MSLERYLNAHGKNKLTDEASLKYFNDTIQPRGYLGASKSRSLETLDSILQWYNLKRASCLQAVSPDDPEDYVIRILVPINTNDTTTMKQLSETSLGRIYAKIGYRDVTAKIPKKYFEGLDKTYLDPMSTSCQNLYVVYCKNMIEAYKSGNGGKLDEGFVDFRPECSCFVPIPEEIAKTGVNVSPLCIMPGCDIVSGVYLDPVSRGNRNCDLTICQANINFSNLQAGGNINLQNKIIQTCGTGAEETATLDKTISPTPNLLDRIPYVSAINKTTLAQYVNKYDPNATTYLLGGSTFLIICCIIIIILIAVFLLF